MEGVGQLAHSLYGLRLEAEPALPGEVWHPDVVKVAVYTTESQLDNELEDDVHPWEARNPIAPGTQIGTVYCDFFNRPDKPPMVSCQFFFRSAAMLRNPVRFQLNSPLRSFIIISRSITFCVSD